MSAPKKNVSEAMALARRALKIDSYLLGDIYASAGLLHTRLCTVLALFTKSGIATSDNLSEIRNAMVENEKAVDGFYKNVNYWHALCLIELWKIRESENMMEVGDDSMPVPSLNELKYLFPQQHCAYLRLFGRDMGSAKEGGNNVIVRMREEALRACRLLTSD